MVSGAIAGVPDRPRSQARLAWRRYRRSWLPVAGAVWVAIFFVAGVIGPWIAPHSYTETDFINANQPPSLKHPFGTDGLGHDMFSQILWSVRNALEIALGATLVSFVIGCALGLWAGLRGGAADMVIMRVVDFMFAFPTYFLDLILVVTLGRGMFPIMIAIGITGWASYARLIRGLVLSMRNGEMVEAARALGASWPHIARRYLLPNSISNMLVALAFGIPADLVIMAALSLVGLGLLPPLPSFGNLIAQAGANVLGYPWLLYFPAGIFAITLLSFLFVADGLQEALDPKGGS
ncbi:ABC transporter permease [Microlunatus elymi]|uniref:ABC transporter permease n=1 Tax=Microlunatus elymi TaxID=2596828 RepID=A0A516PU22_9ACTN|nr:ABC transporter permease [Microlunatus elymi]QDP94642.1 ABC transporter permease [Microlunatus elymi]